MHFGLWDGTQFISINGGQDYLHLTGTEGSPGGLITKTFTPDILPDASQINQLKLAVNHHSGASAFIDVVYAKVQYVSACDPCQEEELTCTQAELEAQQASQDSIKTLWDETPLSEIQLPTKLYRVKLCNGDEVYLLQHELDLLQGNYLILQSINIENWNQTHLAKKQGTDLDELDDNDLFALKLQYYNGDERISNVVAQGYGNGNIAAQYWQVAGRDRQAYGYQYDDLDRIQFAKYADITQDDDYYNHGNYDVDMFNGYDAIGNIQRISRRGPVSECTTQSGETLYSYGQIDNMTYQYNTDKDQLTGITETSINKGFKATSGYTYDDNGNLITDSGKGISQIEYNHLNLPYKVVFNTSEEIHWIYDATGRKLRKNVIGGSETNQVDYIDGIEKDQNNGEFIYHEEGRVYLTPVLDPDSLTGPPLIPSGTMAYTITDHLGNARVTFADLNGDGVITPRDIPQTPEEEPQELLQENHYYAFGMNMEGTWVPQIGVGNQYQYNGKELNEDFGLNWNDYGARWYDVAIGRFTSVDPLAAEMPSWSPF